MEAVNRPGGGVAFRFWLPIEGEPPVVESEERDFAEGERPGAPRP
jgi:hypothetical protein